MKRIGRLVFVVIGVFMAAKGAAPTRTMAGNSEEPRSGGRSEAALAEPQIVLQEQPDGAARIVIRAPGGSRPVVYPVDLSKHYHPARDQSDPTIRRWESYRFGAFVHFNINTFCGTEICRVNDPKRFAPSHLDVAGWIATFKKAGMRYAVLTVRHTSEFLLWDSATTHCDVMASPVAKDVARAFVRECRRQRIAPGFYYCMWGGKKWNPRPNARAVILAQLHELTTKFGEIPLFWIDMMLWAPSDLTAQQVYDAIKSRQRNAVVHLNQHVQDGAEIRYFPTDVLNGEITLPPLYGHDPYRTVEGKRYYLPYEFEAVSQGWGVRRVANTPLGPASWFTYGAGRGFESSRTFPVKPLAKWIKQAYDRGADNVLVAAAPDHTGRLRPEDAEQLVRLGRALEPYLNR
ncbi:MAG TPA: hypothetical protein EYP14_02340 [Planctomycetaceae bacterium]|nr:hypothetical protein [Planctomycetaceae bacterium]